MSYHRNTYYTNQPNLKSITNNNTTIRPLWMEDRSRLLPNWLRGHTVMDGGKKTVKTKHNIPCCRLQVGSSSVHLFLPAPESWIGKVNEQEKCKLGTSTADRHPRTESFFRWRPVVPLVSEARRPQRIHLCPLSQPVERHVPTTHVSWDWGKALSLFYFFFFSFFFFFLFFFSFTVGSIS